jgi:hypothetical protein
LLIELIFFRYFQNILNVKANAPSSNKFLH